MSNHRHGIGALVSRSIAASPLFTPAVFIDQDTGVSHQIRVMMHYSLHRRDSIFDVTETPEFSYLKRDARDVRRFDIITIHGRDYVVGDVIRDDGFTVRRALDPAESCDPYEETHEHKTSH